MGKKKVQRRKSGNIVKFDPPFSVRGGGNRQLIARLYYIPLRDVRLIVVMGMRRKI